MYGNLYILKTMLMLVRFLATWDRNLTWVFRNNMMNKNEQIYHDIHIYSFYQYQKPWIGHVPDQPGHVLGQGGKVADHPEI